ncbi:MAG TPA: cupin domain-containing protein [Mycobacteriales bacterium]|jgi:hypothetical protein|nr:cupin domain-containing protein [Mycobacteriales bacterium]
MSNLISKAYSEPDETRAPDKTTIQIVDLEGVNAARLTLQPGWKWSECIKPIAGTDSCQAHHVGMIESGHMHVVHDDGTEADVVAGSAYRIAPGHDAWVVGDESIVAYEFDNSTVTTYAATS